MKQSALLVLAALAGVGQADAANLLTNGSFETPNIVANGFYTLYPAGSTGIPGWTVVGGPIQLTPDTYLGLAASDGRQWIDMTGITGYDKGLTSDAVATTIGATYTLAFDLGNYVPFGTSTISVSINGGPAKTFTNLVNGPGPMDWEGESLTWLADASTTRITFLGVPNGALSNDSGIGLDNVRFSAAAVPEPGSALMALSGVAGLLTLGRRRLRIRG